MFSQKSDKKILTNIKMSETELEFDNYNNVMNKEGELYLACDLNEGGKKDYSVCNLTQLRPYLDDNHNLYEILKWDKPRYVYLDYDCKYHKIRDLAEGKTDDEVKTLITDTVHSMMENFLGDYGFNEDALCYVLDASNKLKFSFHFKFDLVLKNQEDSEIFHKNFIQFCNDMYSDKPEYYNIHKYIDPNVYTKNRLIRLPNQSKYGQDRPLKPYKGSMNVIDHILTYISKSSEVITIPSVWKTRYSNKYQMVKSIPTKTIEEFNEEEELIWLVEHTLHKREHYSDWITVVWACISAGIPIDIIHKADYDACPEKYDEDATNKVIKQYKEGKGLGKHSLIKWAAEKGYYINREIEKKAKELSDNREDHLTWVDIQKKYHNKEFESFEEMIEIIRDDISQVISYVQGGQSVFTMYSNEDHPFDLTKRLPNFNLKYGAYPDDKEISLQSLIVRNPLKFPLYNKLVFKPLNHGLRRHERNTWIGFKAEKRDSYNMKSVETFKRHVREVLANGDEYSYKYIMTWIWKILNKPWEKTGIFMLFYGEQGTGKTIVSEFLIDYVFGKHLSFTITGLNSITQRFNGCTMSKIFCCCNELSSINDSGNNWHAGFDKLKSYITDKLCSYEMKGLEPRMVENHINFFGTTNNPNCIKVEKGDRRYSCFEVSNKYKGDKEYFDNFGEICKNEEAGNDFYNYMIKDYPKEDLVDLRDIPDTQLRKDLISNSMSQFERFINYFLSEENDMDERKWISKEKKEISKNNLYEEYRFWCGRNGETDKPKHILFRNIPKNKLAVDLSKNPRKTINGNRIYYVKFV
jgi:hypothetical protein